MRNQIKKNFFKPILATLVGFSALNGSIVIAGEHCAEKRDTTIYRLVRQVITNFRMDATDCSYVNTRQGSADLADAMYYTEQPDSEYRYKSTQKTADATVSNQLRDGIDNFNRVTSEEQRSRQSVLVLTPTIKTLKGYQTIQP